MNVKPGMLVNQPKYGYGSSNDGNSVQQFEDFYQKEPKKVETNILRKIVYPEIFHKTNYERFTSPVFNIFRS